VNGQTSVAPSCVAQIVSDVRSWRYRAFEVNGRTTAREFVERVQVLLPERRREENRAFPPVNEHSEVRILLERWGCLGACPSYRVEIRSDGTASYEGYEYVDEVGPRQGAIDQAEFAALLERFRGARFYALLDEYTTGGADLPTYRLTIDIDGQRASVADYDGIRAGMPLVVRDLQDEVDRIANSEQWTGREASTSTVYWWEERRFRSASVSQ
jgi:hypothetical protein